MTEELKGKLVAIEVEKTAIQVAPSFSISFGH